MTNFKVPTPNTLASQSKRASKSKASSSAKGGNSLTSAAAAPPASCDKSITPTCFQDLYGVPATPAPNNGSGTTLFVSGFIDQFANKADLQVRN